MPAVRAVDKTGRRFVPLSRLRGGPEAKDSEYR